MFDYTVHGRFSYVDWKCFNFDFDLPQHRMLVAYESLLTLVL